MLFDSPAFVIFLILVVLLYWRLSWRQQNVFLLGASYFFYGWWDWRFLLLMAGSTCIDYLVAKKLPTVSDPWRRRSLLIFSLVLNFSFLGFFKYFNFFTESFAAMMTTMGFHHVPTSLLRILLPPGISFYTFQEVAYIVDVYKGKLKPADSLIDYALFISLFPHLIAGPIQRPSHLLPQVQQGRTMDWDKFFDGLMLVLFGFFQKCVIADNCAYIANSAFNGNFGATNSAGCAAGNLCIRMANLRRLRRIQQYSTRRRTTARLPLHGQLQAAVSSPPPCKTFGGAGTSA